LGALNLFSLRRRGSVIIRSGIATIMRKTLQGAREPENTRRIFSLMKEIHASNAANSRLHHWLPMGTSVAVNSFSRFVTFPRSFFLLFS
jgi:hypothetical protein